MANEIKRGINKILKDKQYQEVIDLLKKNETGNKDEDRVTPFFTGLFSALAEKEPEKLKEVAKAYLEDQEKRFNDLEQKKKENEELEKQNKKLIEQQKNLDNAVHIEALAENEARDKKVAAEKEAEAIKDKANQEAEKIKAVAQTKAKEDADGIIDKAKKEAVIEKAAEIQKIADERDTLSHEKTEFARERSEDRAQVAKRKLAEAEQADKAVLLGSAMEMKNNYEQGIQCLEQERTQFRAQQTSEEGRITELESLLREKESENQGLRNSLDKLHEAKDTLNQLAAEVNQQTDLPAATDIVQHIQKLTQEKENTDTEIRNIKNELQQVQNEKKKLEDSTRLLEEELAARESAVLESEASRRLASVSRAICDNLMEEMSNLKKSLDQYVGDPCRELSEIDNHDKEHPHKSRPGEQLVPDLKTLVKYVQGYAYYVYDQNKEFTYSLDDIRAFVAGLATSHLLILQGMSGTGKSSLPSIFSKALNFHNETIAVESSWRDRNDLLGYYNDFSRQFNAKPFTKEVYRAVKQRALEEQEQQTAYPRFITLDEMNLSRIEYYFSDFLSVLEKAPSEWEIPLCSKPIQILPSYQDPIKIPQGIEEQWKEYKKCKGNISDQKKQDLLVKLAEHGLNSGAKYLRYGNTLLVPDDLWFIGTANKDDSTFTITDKVYDRAQVLSLDEKLTLTIENIGNQRYYTTSKKLHEMFEYAKNNMQEQYIKRKLGSIDDVLQEKFKLSFGYRIEKQVMAFVDVFCAAGGSVANALDYQISTKILRKVENSDNTEGLKQLRETIAGFGQGYDKSLAVLDSFLNDN